MGRIKQRTARMQAIHHIYCKWSEMESYIYIYCNILQLCHNTESLLMTTTNWRTSFNHRHVSPCNPMMMQTETVSPNFNTANPRCPPHVFLLAHMYMYKYIYTHDMQILYSIIYICMICSN